MTGISSHFILYIDLYVYLVYFGNVSFSYLHVSKQSRKKQLSLHFISSAGVMSLKAIGTTCPCNETLLHPTLYSKTGVYRGIHFLPIFNLKHRLWVLVRTACEADLTCTNNLCFEQKYENNKKNQLKIVIFTDRMDMWFWTVMTSI